MRNSRRNLILLISLPVLFFVAWFSWMSYSQSKIDWIQEKVSQAMIANIESLVPQWPRIEYKSSSGDDPYYAPDIYNQGQVFDLYIHLLENLNTDNNLPPVKVTQVSIMKNIGETEDTLIVQARVEFPLFAGFDKEIVVRGAGKIPHFKSAK
jgi:hypothetical protein